MQKRFLVWLLPLVWAACTVVRLQAQPTAPAATGPVISAQIIATKITGTVKVRLANQTKTLGNNETVATHSVVITEGANSSVVLVFSNGATTQLGKDTELSIDEFLQDPFAATINPADPSRDSEPTISQTKLRLTHGELVGNVKHLNHAQGSTFVVETPVGAAGIRGTVFRVVFVPDPVNPGRYTFQLAVPQGAVALTQNNATGGITTTTTITTQSNGTTTSTTGNTTTQTDTTTSTGTTTQTGGTTPATNTNSTTSTATAQGLSTAGNTVQVPQGNAIEVYVNLDTKTVTNPTTGVTQTVITATTSAPIIGTGVSSSLKTIDPTLTATLMNTATTITTVAATVTNNFTTTTATGAVTTSVTNNPTNPNPPSNTGTSGNTTTSTTTTTTTSTTNNQASNNQNPNNPTSNNPAPTTQTNTTSTITQSSPGATTTVTLTPGAGH